MAEASIIDVREMISGLQDKYYHLRDLQSNITHRLHAHSLKDFIPLMEQPVNPGNKDESVKPTADILILKVDDINKFDKANFEKLKNLQTEIDTVEEEIRTLKVALTKTEAITMVQYN